MIKFLDLRKQYESIKSEIDDAIRSVIHESAFIGGKYVNKFEEHFASYQQVKHCVGVANGTDALEIAIESLSLPEGGEIIVPANTFMATSEAVTRSGYRVVFCDCDPTTYTIDLDDAARRITPRTCAIIPVHLYGHPCDMDAILDFAKKHNLKVIEDCAQAHGAEYKGQRVGGIGDVGTFSFYPGKNIGAYGDGGSIVTNSDILAKRCRMIANHGRTDKYLHECEGRNSRLDGLQAAILNVKLKYADLWNLHRRQVAEFYQQHLKNIGEMKQPSQASWAKHAWHLYVIRTEKRDLLQSYLQENGVQTGIHYPIALPKQPAYYYLGQRDEPMFANTADQMLISLPIGSHLEATDLNTIVEVLLNFFKSGTSHA